MEVCLHQGSAFSPFLFAIIIDSLTKGSTLAYDVRGRCGAVCKGESRAGGGTGIVDGYPWKRVERSVKNKDRVHMSEALCIPMEA